MLATAKAPLELTDNFDAFIPETIFFRASNFGNSKYSIQFADRNSSPDRNSNA